MLRQCGKNGDSLQAPWNEEFACILQRGGPRLLWRCCPESLTPCCSHDFGCRWGVNPARHNAYRWVRKAAGQDDYGVRSKVLRNCTLMVFTAIEGSILQLALHTLVATRVDCTWYAGLVCLLFCFDSSFVRSLVAWCRLSVAVTRPSSVN